MPFRLTVSGLPVEELLAIARVPVAVPAAAGSNCTVTVVDCPGFSVVGRPPLVIEKPAPVTVAPLSVTAAVPVEFSVTLFVAAVLIVCVPKFRLVTLGASVGVTAFSCSANTAVPPAVSVAVCVVDTAETVAVKLAVFVPAATVTDAGIVTAGSLLVSATLWPFVPAAPLSVTVQASVPAPVSDLIPQLNPATVCVAAVPVPESPTPVVFFELFDELPTTAELVAGPPLVTVSVPVELPCAIGANVTFTVMLAPAARLTGSTVLFASANASPVAARSVTSTGVLPGFVIVTVDCAVDPTVTDPNATASGVNETVASAAALVLPFDTYPPHPLSPRPPSTRLPASTSPRPHAACRPVVVPVSVCLTCSCIAVTS